MSVCCFLLSIRLYILGRQAEFCWFTLVSLEVVLEMGGGDEGKCHSYFPPQYQVALAISQMRTACLILYGFIFGKGRVFKVHSVLIFGSLLCCMEQRVTFPP